MDKINVVLSDNFQDLNRKMLRLLDTRDLSKQNIIIVPDRYSLICEKEVFSALGVDVVLNVSVMGSTRFASMIFARAGMEYEFLSREESLLLVFLAMKKVAGRLKCFIGEINAGVCEQILHTIIQLKSNEVTPELLRESLGGVSGFLKLKLEDVCLIYEEYNVLLGDKLDNTQIILKLIENLDNMSLEEYNLFYVNFDSFSKHWYSLFKAITPKVNSVYVGAIKSNSQPNSFIFEEDVYFKLNELVEKCGFTLEVESAPNALSLNQNLIHKNLYRVTTSAEAPGEYLRVFEAENKQKEIEIIAKYIKYLVCRKGVKFNEVCVACGEINAYADEVKRVFKEYGFSFFIDEDKSLLDTATVRFLVDFIKIIAGIVDKNIIENFISSPLFGENQTEKNELIELLRKTDDYENFSKYELFTNSDSEYKNDYFADALKEEIISNFVEKTRKIIEKINLFQKNAQILEYFSKTNNLLNEKYYMQIETKLNKCIDSIERIMGDKKSSLLGYIEILEHYISSINLSTVPVGVDTIFVGDATMSYFEEKDYFFLIGANDNLLPRMLGDNLILDDDSISTLDKFYDIAPTIKMINRRNRFKLFNILLLARKKLVVSYPLMTENNEKLLPAGVVKDLLNIFKVPKLSFEDYFKLHIESLPPSAQAEALCEFLGVRGNVEKEFVTMSTYENMLDKDVFCSINNFRVGGEEVVSYEVSEPQKLFFKNNTTKISQIEKYMDCPFKHFVTYGLKLKDQEMARINTAEVGNFLHEVAQMFLEPKFDNLRKISENNEKISKIVEKIQYFILKKDNFRKFSLKCNKNTLKILRDESVRLCEYLYNSVIESKFKPRYLEVDFGKGDFAYTLNVDGENFGLVGKVDRVDFYGNKFVVIDYKSGKVPSGAPSEIYYGLKIQTFVYMQVLSQVLNSTGVGAYYFPVRNEFNSDNKKNYQATGRTLESAADIVYEAPNVTGENIFTEMANYSIEIVKNAVREIKSGYINPSPSNDNCLSCPYLSLCGGGISRVKNRIVAKDFSSEVEDE